MGLHDPDRQIKIEHSPDREQVDEAALRSLATEGQEPPAPPDPESARIREERTVAELHSVRAELARRAIEVRDLREEIKQLRANAEASALEINSNASSAVAKARSVKKSAFWASKKRRFRFVPRRTSWRRLFARITRRLAANQTLREDVAFVAECGLFDEAWYLSKYGGVTSEGMDAVTHYLRYGSHAQYDPGPGFNTAWYLETYSDVRQSGMNPLVHYLRWGRKEGRFPLPRDFRFAPTPLPQADTEGRLEDFSDGIIAGWVVRLRDNNRPVEIEILVNNIPYKRARADASRPDVKIADTDRIAVGFSATIDLGQFDSNLVHFSARIAGSTQLLGSELSPVQPPGASTNRSHSVRPLPVPPKATIVVPVFNAPNETKACIESVLANLPPWAELLISDDASDDAAVGPVLRAFEGLERVRIVRRAQNAGYTINVNEALRLVPDGDIVLLNSDTLVPPNWLRLLQRAAYSEDRVGTVTPLSDNAGAFSAPILGQKNDLPAWHGSEEFARLVANESRRTYPVVPTGSGFCFYIRRELIDAIGLFDEATFPRGYGEENDFCMRAQQAGWKNIICDDVYVRHARSASFQETKTELVKRAVAIVSKRYPDYLREVRASFTDSDEFCGVRYRIAHASLRRPDAARPRILFVLGVESGGTPQTNLDLMSSIQAEFEPILFLCDTRKGRVFRMIGRTKFALEEFRLQEPIQPITHDSPEYSAHVSRILDDYAIEAVHIRHLGRHGLSIIDNAKAKGIPVVLSFHDFYTVCPNVKLVDAAGTHCGGICTTGEMGDCNVELWEAGESGFPPLKHNWVRRWQSMMSSALDKVDHFITTSPLARDLMISIYPHLARKPFDIVEHGRDFRAFQAFASPLRHGEPLRVLVPGILTPAKGLDLIKAVKALDRDNRIEFHFLGKAIEPLEELGIPHGKYLRDRFAEHVEKIRPHIGAVLSIWPETYCHTLTEMWACGLPVVVTGFGAPEERVMQHGGGWVLAGLEPSAVYAQLLEIARDQQGLAEKVGHVTRWQAEQGRAYGVEAMSLHYRQIYRQLLRRGARHATAAVLPKLVYAMHADPARSADFRFGTAHTLPFLTDQLGSAEIVIESVSHSTLLALPRLPPPDAVLLQCDGTGRLDRQTLALLCDRGGFGGPDAANGGRWSLFVEICYGPRSTVRLTEEEWCLVDAADGVVSTGASPGEASSSEAAAPVPAATYPDVLATDFMSINAAAIDAALSSNGSLSRSEIRPHNEPFIVAQQVLVDWPRLHALAAARQCDRVSIVIPVFNVVELTRRCLETITAKTQYPDYEIILVDNGSKPDVAEELRSMLADIPRARFVRNVSNLMFAMGCNVGGASSTGQFIVFLNNDIEIISDHWLGDLVEPLRVDPSVGIAGAKLLYPDGTIQHSGIVFGEASLFPYHIYKSLRADHPAVNRMRTFRAVTGACMAMRASDFIKLRGFDPVFVNGSEDVDLCLRMETALHRSCLYVPSAELVHHEGKSPGRGTLIPQNRRILVDRWRDRIVSDDQRYYEADGLVSGVSTYETDSAD